MVMKFLYYIFIIYSVENRNEIVFYSPISYMNDHCTGKVSRSCRKIYLLKFTWSAFYLSHLH